MDEASRQQTALFPEKSIRFFDHLPISAFVRPDSSEHSVRFQPGNLFFPRLWGGGILIRWASAAALSVLPCESKAMIFSLLFTFFSLLLAGFSPLFILNHVMIKVRCLCIFQPVRFPVPVHQGAFYIGSPVQDSAADLGIWQYAVVAVILEAPAADFKYHSQLLVGIIAFPVQRGFIVFTYFLHPV